MHNDDSLTLDLSLILFYFFKKKTTIFKRIIKYKLKSLVLETPNTSSNTFKYPKIDYIFTTKRLI